ncbi:MAG: nucleotidyltransferase family protein [Chloroflexi bacterium]|nr:nucleotidyltransferase family protein [Chloroflexota bacterium]
MGQPKALLPWQGTSLLEHQVSALRSAGADKVVVVLGHQPEQLIKALEEMEGATWVINPDYLEGKTTSIKAGVGALGAEKPDILLILNVDQPRSADTVRFLLQEHRSGKGLITIPEYRGKGGHPILLDPSLLDELGSIEEESLGIKAVVRRHQDSTRRVSMDNPEVLWDLNTPEEYHSALRSQT